MENCRELMNWLLFGYWHYSSRKLPLTSNRCLNFRILPVNLQLQAFSSSNTRKKVPSSPRRLLSLTWLFVSLWFFVPLENFSLIWKRHNCRWRAANLDLCSALMAIIEQWGFFSVPHLLWHGASIYDGHLQGPVTITPNVER